MTLVFRRVDKVRDTVERLPSSAWKSDEDVMLTLIETSWNSGRLGRHHTSSEKPFSDISCLARDAFLPTSTHLRPSRHMCGIFFSIAKGQPLPPNEDTAAHLRARGPDAFRTVSIKTREADRILTFSSSVLALRGDDIQEQPLCDEENGSVFCWNGEAWKSDNEVVVVNDSRLVFHKLLSATAAEHPPTAIAQVLSNLAGPFAFVFYDGRTSTAYFGRDGLGRRSLIIREDDDKSLSICSISTSDSFPAKEVATESIFSVVATDETLRISALPWPHSRVCINSNLPSASTPLDKELEHACAGISRALTTSLKLRVLKIPDHQAIQIDPSAARMAILFSGGLDCTLLARMCHDILPSSQSIDLLNVAFENPRAMQARTSRESPYDICPDRITGLSSFTELLRISPGRCWRFVAINIPYAEAERHQSIIIKLLRPHNTEMDLSIGMALYFAARGEGIARVSAGSSHSQIAYTTSARVLLSGLGADELFGGYSRHAAAFQRAGYRALVEELDLDFGRIGQRNLGRDDRVISHWGKEVRYPYLDEDFTRISLQLPVWAKCGFRIGGRIPKHHEEITKVGRAEDLEPSKRLLRLILWDLGMEKAASERKRAIQFGAKTAKMEVTSGKRKGTEVLTR
jgi:asparagine synthetase B (glutamine-hydrolysing)